MTGTALIEIDNIQPVELFSEDSVQKIISKITDIVNEHETDISTEKGRKELKSLAYKIARSKTLIDDAGKTLVADWKSKSKVVDAQRKILRDTLDKLKEDTLQPLTDFENKEKARIEEHEDYINRIIAAGEDLDHVDREGTEKRIAALKSIKDLNRNWEEFETKAVTLFGVSIAKLNSRLEEIANAEKIETERLARIEAEKKKAEEERIEVAKKEAAEQAKRDAEQKAQQELDRAREAEKIALREKAEAEQKIKDAEERAKQEKQRAIEAERARQEQEKIKAEQEKKAREENQKHREKINGEAVAAFSENGIDQETADRIIKLISSGSIKHVSIQY